MNNFALAILIILIIFSIFFLYIFIKIIVNFFRFIKKDYRIYKFNIKSIFHGKFSLVIILLFYFISFGLAGGMQISTLKFEKVNNNNINNQHLWQANIPSLRFNLDNINADAISGDWSTTTGGIVIDTYKTYFHSLYPTISLNQVINLFGSTTKTNETKDAIATLILFNHFIHNQYTDLNNLSYTFHLNYSIKTHYNGQSYLTFQSSFQPGSITYSDPLVESELMNNSLYQINEPEIVQVVSGFTLADFYRPHIGTQKDPYQVFVNQDYYELNNLHLGGESYWIGGNYYQLVGTYYAPEQTYQLSTSTKSPFPDKDSEALVLINLQDLLHISYGDEAKKWTIFFGFNDVYSELTSYQQWMDLSGKSSNNLIYLRTQAFLKQFNEYYFSPIEFDLGSSEQISYQKYYSQDKITTILDRQNLIDIQANQIFYYTYQNNILAHFMSLIFIFIVIVVLALIIKKKIADSSVQIGTLKALGYENSRIINAFLLVPITIVTLGFFLTMISIWPMALLFTTIFGQYYSLNVAGYYLSFAIIRLIYFLPLIITIVFSYFIIKWKIKKPTLTLLANETKNKPNFLTKTTAVLLPKWTSFSFAYKYKGFFRQTSRSLLLIISVVLAIFLSSFALAASTMVKKTATETFNTLNYDVKTFDNSTSTVEYLDTASPIYSSPQPLNLDVTKLEWIIIVNKINNGTINDFHSLADELWALFIPKLMNFDLSTTLFSITSGPDIVPTITSNYYLPADTMINLSIFYFFTISDYGDTLIGSSSYTLNDFNSLFILYFSTILQNLYLQSPNLSLYQLINFDFSSVTINQLADYITNNFDKFTQFFSSVYFNQIVYSFDTSSPTQANYQTVSNSADFYLLDSKASPQDLQELIIANQSGTLSSYFSNDYNSIYETTYFEAFPTIDQLATTLQLSQNNYDALDNYSQSPINYNSIPIISNNYTTKILNDFEQELITLKATTFPNLLDGFYYQPDLSDNIYPVILPTLMFNSNTNHYDNSYYLTTVEIVSEYDLSISIGALSLTPYLENNFTTQAVPEFTWKYDANLDQVVNPSSTDINYFNFNSTYQFNGVPSDSIPILPSNVSLQLSSNFVTSVLPKNPSAITTTDITFDSYINYSLTTTGFKSSHGFPFRVADVVNASKQVYQVINIFLIALSVFAMFIAVIIIIIAMKDIIDSSTREIAMLKAFGYSNQKSTSLVMTPYIFIILFSFIASVLIVIYSFIIINWQLTLLTGIIFTLHMTLIQWLIVILFISFIIIFVFALSYFVFSKVNALDAISQTN